MAEVVAQFPKPMVTDQSTYLAQACGAPTADRMWEGWIEFIPVGGGTALRSRRETTQPNLRDLRYWASGLTMIYLEGALRRALEPTTSKPVNDARAVFNEPAAHTPDAVSAPPSEPDAVLDPFSVYGKGETLLRNELAALSAWHLVNIARAYRLSPERSATLNAMTAEQLVDLIVDAVAQHHADAAPAKEVLQPRPASSDQAANRPARRRTTGARRSARR